LLWVHPAQKVGNSMARTGHFAFTSSGTL